MSIILYSVAAGGTGAATYAIVTASLRRPPEFVGVLTTVMGTGALAGGLLAARLVDKLGELTAIGVGVAAYSAAVAALAVPSVPVALAAMTLAGIGVTIPVVGRLTLLQRRAPGEIMGQVSFAFDALTNATQLAAMAASASLLAAISVRWVLLPIALAGALGAVTALRNAESRTGLD